MIVSKKNIFYSLFSLFFIFFILLMPTALLYKIELGALDFSLSYVMLIMLLLLASFDFILQYKKIYRNRFFLLILLYLSHTIISFIFTGFNFNLIFPVVIFLLFFVFGYLNYNFIIKDFSSKLIKLSFFISLFGLILHYLNIPLIDFKNAGNDGYFSLNNGLFRAVSVFMNPNNFGFFLIFVIPFQLYRLDSKMNNIILIINVFALYKTYSRSALLVFILVISIILVKKIKDSKKVLLFATTFIVFSIIMLIVIYYDYLLLYDIRFIKWGIGFSFVFDELQNFLFGISKHIPIVENDITFSDNWYVFIWLHSGIFSLVVWLAFQYEIMKKSIKLFFRTSNKNIMSLSLYSIGIFIPFILSNYIQFFPASFLTALSFGVISATPLEGNN